MKRKLLIIGTVLAFALAMPMFGQADQGNLAKVNDKKMDMPDMAAKPTFEATTAGIHLKVWITVKEGEIKENDMSSAKATKEVTTASSYHVMVELKNAESGKDVADVTATLMAVSPTDKNSSIELKPMTNQFGGNLALDEKGEYTLTVNLNVGGVTNATPFKYTVN